MKKKINCPKCLKDVNLKYIGDDSEFNIFQCPNCNLPVRFKKQK